MYWRDIAEAKTEKMEEYAQTIHDLNGVAARHRAENERLRRACLQVREWGIELASLQPVERERRFVVLWQYINETLRTAVLHAEEPDRGAGSTDRNWAETKLWIQSPGLTAVHLVQIPGSGMDGIEPRKHFDVELDQITTDEAGTMWRYADWYGFCIMSQLTPAEQAARQNETKTVADLSAAERTAFCEALDEEWPEEEDHWADEELEY